MADPNNMTCDQLAAAIAAEQDPRQKTELEILFAEKGCGAQTSGDDDGGGIGGNDGDSGNNSPPPTPPPHK